jgi:uncharacterized protein
VTTNATLITKNNSYFLNKYFDSISISIDGLPVCHNKHRKYLNDRNTYDDCLKGFSYLDNSKKSLIARLTVACDLAVDLYDNVLHLINLGFKIIEPCPDISDKWDSDSAKILEEQFFKLADFQKNQENNINNIEIRGIGYAASKVKNAKCDGGVSSFQIAADGNLYPCAYTVDNPKYKLGNVCNTNKLDNEVICFIENISSKSVSTCVGCTRYDYCMATKCRLVNLVSTGNALLPLPILCLMENISVNTSK